MNYLALHHVAPNGTIFTHVRSADALDELMALAQTNDTLHKVSELAASNLTMLDWEIRRNIVLEMCVQLNATELTCPPSN